MPDREKVIAGLAGIANCLYPYIGSKQIRACLDAIELLKEQEPVVPKTDGTSIYDVDGYIVCGKCGGNLGMPEVFNFCPWCGRAVKWNA